MASKHGCRTLSTPNPSIARTFDVGLETIAKALELLKEAIPRARHVAVLSNPGNPAQALAITDLKAAAQSLGLRLLLLEAGSPDEFGRVFVEAARERVDAIFIVAESLFLLHRTPLAGLALKHRAVSAAARGRGDSMKQQQGYAELPKFAG